MKVENKSRVKEASRKTKNAFMQAIPVLLGVFLLIGLILTAVPKESYSSVFSGNVIIDSVIGGAAGSIAAGNPLTSYVIGGELIDQGVGLVAIIAFIVAWVTVGIVQLPAESYLLGKKFALVRNSVSFILSIIIAILTVMTLNFLGVFT